MSARPSLRDGCADRPLPDHAESISLAKKARRGDVDALNELLTRYDARLRRIVRIRLGARLHRHVDSVDIVQETFTVAIRKIRDLDLRHPGCILHWLARIAERKILDARRYHFAQKRDPDRTLPIGVSPSGSTKTDAAQVPAPNESPSEEAYRGELKQLMDQAIAKMPEDEREVVLLRDYSGCDWETVVELMGRPSIGACRELHRRAWWRLRTLLAPKI